MGGRIWKSERKRRQALGYRGKILGIGILRFAYYRLEKRIYKEKERKKKG